MAVLLDRDGRLWRPEWRPALQTRMPGAKLPAQPISPPTDTLLSGQPSGGAQYMATSAPIRVVVAKPGLDGHDRGAKVVARALRDAGMEVIYTGLHQTPEQIVDAAIQEDADCIGLSVLSGAHMTLFTRVMELLQERDATDIVLFGGGIIPEDDIPELEKIGVSGIFTPGATTGEIVNWVTSHVAAPADA
jgi:Methylmalonyl-CoA mutase, C-terminal domain/subunit (cobalamin-binding)